MNSQKNGCLILLIILLSFEYSNSQVIGALQKGITDKQVEQLILDTRIKVNSILKKEVYLPGIAVAIVSRDKILLAEGFGYRDKLRRARVDSNTIFGILSVSKPVTVTGLMIAEQEGLLNFDVPIKNYLPGFTIQSRFNADPMSEITIRHLISMTSGLTHDAPVGNNADPYSPSYESHIQSISQTWLRFRTGEHAEYSNLGIELAAYCLEQVIHKPFTEYIREKVFDPIGMNRSTYDFRKIENDPNRAVGNNRNFDTVPLGNPMLAPGAVYSSISDMARFIQFHLNQGKINGHEILQEKIINQMQTIPFRMQGQIAGYGQGLEITYYHLGGQDVRCIEHGGGGFGFRCQMKWMPELGYGVMVMTNSQDHNNVNENLTEEILLKIVELVTGKKNSGPSDWLKRHVPLTTVGPGFLPDNLEGNYNGTNDDMKILIRDSVLGYVSGTSFVPLKPVTPAEFVSGDYLYRFIIDINGKSLSMVRPYDGMQWNISESKYEQKGPGKEIWRKYEGTYIRKRFGRAERFYIVKMNNGRLHFIGDGQDCVLNEFRPGMFYMPNGEVVDFSNKPSTYRNIKLYKTSTY
ncbi:MAG: serine hydrolase domain-containing protein [Bacteroidota bacterium]